MPFAAQIESVRAAIANIGGSQAGQDFRTLIEGLVQWQAQTNPTPPAATNPAAASATQAGPVGVTAQVSGANGVYSIAIDNGDQNGRAVWNQIAYATVQSFTAGLVTMAPTAATQITINLPGETLFFRLRSSFDQKSWSAWQFIGDSPVQPVASGLVTAAAQDEGVAFNQTNYAIVSSAAVGGAAAVRIAGPSGGASAATRQKGPVQSILPGGVVDNVPFGTSHFVGYKPGPTGYRLLPTLADVLQDNLAPVGKVSVVDSGTPTLPALTPVIVSGYLVGATGALGTGLSALPTLTVSDPGGPGAGAVIVGVGPVAGSLTGTQVLNPGNGHYDSNTIITASGGIGSGASGGGTAAGGNGGRMTAV
jgi:hypothetical protein